jgi:hypothetical protein
LIKLPDVSVILILSIKDAAMTVLEDHVVILVHSVMMLLQNLIVLAEILLWPLTTHFALNHAILRLIPQLEDPLI